MRGSCSCEDVVRPTVVCFVGSCKFEPVFRRHALIETLSGKVVLSLSFNLKTDPAFFAPANADEIKATVDLMYKYKIDLADEILVINVGGYIGDSTRDEIEYAKSKGKRIRWLEDPGDPAQLSLGV